MRADARRNRDKIVEAAAQVVAERGVDVPMEAVARRAGVGVGTLYRRFPDRAALIAAVGHHYLDSIGRALADAADRAPDPWTAVRDFVHWVASSGRGALAAALAELPEDAVADPAAFEADRHAWEARLDELVRRAQAEGRARPDVTADDVVHLLTVFTCHPGALPPPVAAHPERYLDLLLDGMSAGAGR